ncbi:MAG: hypothetical protein EYC62_06175 [Alphaproteobacteria bacterium]|nr:MAG: hypothetical protein EYC62_06175 [Alphaproteobacteria bacterium]
MRYRSLSVAAAFLSAMILANSTLASPPPSPPSPVAVDPAPLNLPPAPGAQNPGTPSSSPSSASNDPFNPLNSMPPAASPPPPSNNSGTFDPFATVAPAATDTTTTTTTIPTATTTTTNTVPLAIPNTPLTIPPPQVAPTGNVNIPTGGAASPFGSASGGVPPAPDMLAPEMAPPPVQVAAPAAKPKPKFKPSLASGKKAFDKNQFDLASKHLLPLARKGNVEAQYLMGVVYSHAKGKMRDYQKAAHWYDKAAEKGSKEAQFNLGFMLYQGAGDSGDKTSVAQDYTQAAKYLKMAADQGVPMAQHLMGLLHLRGQGVAMNMYEALRWSSLAADNGIHESMYNAAMLSVRRPGATMQDYINAYKWFTILTAQGYPGAAENRMMITKYMPYNAIQYADALARNWRAPDSASNTTGMDVPATINTLPSATSAPVYTLSVPPSATPWTNPDTYQRVDTYRPAWAPQPMATMPLPAPGNTGYVPPNYGWSMGMEKVPAPTPNGQPQMAQPMNDPNAWPWPQQAPTPAPVNPYPQINQRERYMMMN